MSQVRQDGNLAVHVVDVFRIVPLDDDALDGDILRVARTPTPKRAQAKSSSSV